MDEFALIKHFFKPISNARNDIIFGIGDDAACVEVPPDYHLLISCDTLVAGVHFLSTWDAYDIAYKAVLVNVSDIAAMAGKPCWLTLGLTLPESNPIWLQRFAKGLSDALRKFNLSLIGGDTTRGPLTISMTIHGLIPKHCAVRRNGAKPGDIIFVSGELGAAALAVEFLQQPQVDIKDRQLVMQKLLRPNPRVDLSTYLQQYASAAIDISDGLAADLNHICEESQVGACIFFDSIPIHALVKQYHGKQASQLVLHGGDDYELCFTIPKQKVVEFQRELKRNNITCYPMGEIQSSRGLWTKQTDGSIVQVSTHGYNHF